MTVLGVRFAKWGLGFFVFGLFLTFGVIGHYCVGASADAGELFRRNVTLWWACPWTLSVAIVQGGGLGLFSVHFTGMVLAFNETRHALTRLASTA